MQKMEMEKIAHNLFSMPKGVDFRAIIDFEGILSYLGEVYKTDCFVMLLCARGGAVMEIDDRTWDVRHDYYVFLMPHVKVCIVSAMPNVCFWYMAFSEHVVIEKCFRVGPHFFDYMYKHPVMAPSEGARVCLRGVYFQLDYFLRKEGKFREDKCMNLVQNLFYDAYDKVCEEGDFEDDEKSDGRRVLLMRFTKLVDENCAREHSVEFYARELCVSPRYLHSVVTSSLGNHTPKELIDDRVIFEAKSLLRNSQLSVQEIAGELGFADQSVFARLFKRKTGMSPIGWRKNGAWG